MESDLHTKVENMHHILRGGSIRKQMEVCKRLIDVNKSTEPREMLSSCKYIEGYLGNLAE